MVRTQDRRAVATAHCSDSATLLVTQHGLAVRREGAVHAHATLFVMHAAMAGRCRKDFVSTPACRSTMRRVRCRKRETKTPRGGQTLMCTPPQFSIACSSLSSCDTCVSMPHCRYCGIACVDATRQCPAQPNLTLTDSCGPSPPPTTMANMYGEKTTRRATKKKKKHHCSSKILVVKAAQHCQRAPHVSRNANVAIAAFSA
jgi:hypothetical protein